MGIDRYRDVVYIPLLTFTENSKMLRLVRESHIIFESTVGPLGRKVVTPNPPLSASHGAQRGVEGHNFSTQWSHCFGFGPSRSLFQGSLSELTPLSEFSPLSYIDKRWKM